MAEEHGSCREHDSTFGHVKQHVKHGAERLKNFRPRGNVLIDEAANKGEDGPLHTGVQEPHGIEVDRSNIEDFPYDESRMDGFTSELASVADEDDITSPKSQCSFRSLDTLNSSASGFSWSSNQKTISGLGTKEGHPQEVLGPYKPNGVEQVLEDVPSEYQSYINDRNTSLNSGSPGNSFGRSSSASSEQSVSDCLYADLASISDDELHVPEVAKISDNVVDIKLSPAADETSRLSHHISHMKLHQSDR